MNIHKIAGIDIGSNSVRLLVANVIVDGSKVLFKKSSLTRLPIRLGTDAFGEGLISPKRVQMLTEGMKAYEKIMNVHEVEHYRACATSALREASNGPQITETIRQGTGISIELIDGAEEAKLIFQADFMAQIEEGKRSFLYIDVGGGSTELTLFHGKEIKASRSFRIGTIRLLHKQVSDDQWKTMQNWIKDVTKDSSDITMIGSGGNINRTFKLAQSKNAELSIPKIARIKKDLEQYEPEERMLRFDLNPDRSDVITHALDIYLSASRWAGARAMMVPKKGLADGMVKDLFYREFPQYQE